VRLADWSNGDGLRLSGVYRVDRYDDGWSIEAP
jgi:hypothetical protein